MGQSVALQVSFHAVSGGTCLAAVTLIDRLVFARCSHEPGLNERAAGRAAAERLSDEWPDVDWVPEAPTEAWADVAVSAGTQCELERVG